MADAKSEAGKQRRARETSQRDEPPRYEYAGLSQLAQATGDCATELVTGSARVVGGLMTDLFGMVLDPCDRLLGSGDYSRERRRQAETDLQETGRRTTHRLSRALTRAVSGVADTVTRSNERFRGAIESEGEPPETSEEPPR
jgi:hypothetical protein